jgi:integrase
VLSDADVRRVVEAAWRVDTAGEWGGDLGRLILLLAATGSRFSGIVRLRVADVQSAQSRIMVPVSHKGSGRKAVTNIGVRIGEDVLAALRPAIAGRHGTEILLLRPRWRRVGFDQHEKAGRAAWGDSAQLNKLWAAILKAAEMPADLVPYCLRHSGIVRALGAGLPIRLVAALHDTSSSMIEAHYAAYIVDALDEIAARAVVPLMAPASKALRRVGS